MSSLLIDGDLLVFKSGFAAERAQYHLVIHGKTIPFSKKRELDTYVKENKIEDYTIEKERILEPIENALSNCKGMLVDICERFPHLDYKVYMSGKNNFREKVDPQYKANRDPTHRPHWEKEIREYIKRYWNGETVDGMEADDAIGIAATQGAQARRMREADDVIVTLDKDLKMIPGSHYNWDKKELTYIDRFSAEASYLQQFLIGDTSDNIPGIDGIGPAKAYAALYDPESGEFYHNLERLYIEQFGKAKAAERFNMNKLLLWICRHENDIPNEQDIQRIISGEIAFQRFEEPTLPFSRREEPEGFFGTKKKSKKPVPRVRRYEYAQEPVPEVRGDGGNIEPPAPNLLNVDDMARLLIRENGGVENAAAQMAQNFFVEI